MNWLTLTLIVACATGVLYVFLGVTGGGRRGRAFEDSVFAFFVLASAAVAVAVLLGAATAIGRSM